jgi:hypothetical protein
MSSVVNIDTNDLIVNVQDESPIVNVNNETITLNIESGGLIAVSQDLTMTAGASLSALRAVTSDGNGDAVYASNDTLANAQVIGVTLGAANSGDQVGVKTFGIMTDANWTWTKGAVYLGTNGQLTQTAPTGGAIIVQVGKAMTATQLFVDVDTTITTV